MKKVRPIVARNARELAKVLGLAPADGMEIEFRSDLNDKIIEVVAKKGLTHSEVARLAHTSRTRVTAILNRNTHDISTDLMLRVLASLGCKRNSNSRALPDKSQVPPTFSGRWTS
jgi:predicted XRE-type DNA-binding protein